METINQLLQAVESAFAQEKLVKLTLSKSLQKDSELKNIYGRRILVKKKPVISWTFRYKTRDEVKNVTLSDALAQLREWLGANFGIATLLTTERDITWEQNAPQLKTSKASHQQAPAPAHDHAKAYLIPENSPFLVALGISSQQGKVHAAHQDKFRQINKYVEIMDSILSQIELPQPAHLVDMGCGKGYLTFALYQHWRETRGLDIRITGIELRPHLTDFCNKVAAQLGWDKGLRFEAKNILAYDNNELDILVALHACDIATDIAIAKGIWANAQAIVTAPCCHRQIRQQMKPVSLLQPILKHGIMEERQAEMITDGIRALLMEQHAYRTRIFEFISSEHTAKNLLIVGTRGTQHNPDAAAHIARIKSEFGIDTHYLESLLQASPDLLATLLTTN